MFLRVAGRLIGCNKKHTYSEVESIPGEGSVEKSTSPQTKNWANTKKSRNPAQTSIDSPFDLEIKQPNRILTDGMAG